MPGSGRSKRPFSDSSKRQKPVHKGIDGDSEFGYRDENPGGEFMASEGSGAKIALIIVAVVVGGSFLLGCLGVLAAIAIPAFLKYKERSAAAAAEEAAIERHWQPEQAKTPAALTYLPERLV
jgi:hypothetical protein